MSMEASGIAVDRVGTEPEDELGSKVSVRGVAGDGLQEWVYVFNDEAATAFAPGDVIVRDPSATTETIWGGLVAAAGTVFAKAAVLGVAQHAIAAGSYGYVQTRGKGLLKNGTANISADVPVTTGGDSAGTAIDMAAGAEHGVIGLSLEAEATNDTTFDVWLDI